VTATTIQFSYSRTEHEIDHWVNGFWYSSLVFSVASVANSLFGIIWRQAVYRSPESRLPWWVHLWIKRTPLVFLIISVATFSAGLCIFTYASHQPAIVCILVTTFTACSSFGLLAVSSWFVFERFSFSRYNGRRWPSDIISDLNRSIWRALGAGWALRLASQCMQQAARKLHDLSRATTRCLTSIIPGYNPRNNVPSQASESDLEIQSKEYLNRPTNHTFATAEGIGHAATYRRTIMGAQTRRNVSAPPTARSLAMITTSRKALEHVTVTQIVPVHQALVRNLAFSPNGQLLATCSWDRTATLLRTSVCNASKGTKGAHH